LEKIFGGELRRLHHRQIGGLFTFEDATRIDEANRYTLMHLVCSFQSLVTQGKSEYAGSVPSRAWPERVIP